MVNPFKPDRQWTGEGSRDYLTIVDVLGTSGSGAPGNSVNSIALTLGIGYSGESRSADALLFNPPGIISIPMGPGSFDSNGTFTASNTSPTAAQAIAYMRDDQWIVLGTRDTRSQFTCGNLQAGETAVFAPSSPAVSVWKQDGSITHMTTAADGENKVYFQVSPTAFTMTAPWGSMVFDATGFHIRCANGAAFDMSGLNFGPLSSLSSFINMSAGSVNIPAGAITLGLPGSQGYQQATYSLAPIPTGVPLPPFSTTSSSSVYIGL